MTSDRPTPDTPSPVPSPKARSRAVTWKCESQHEADVICNAVNRYRHVLKDQGVDPRNYAPANEQGAGFGWETIQRAASDMHTGTITHMSVRIAEAIETALTYRAEHHRDDYATTAGKLATRMGNAITFALHGT